MCVMAKAINQCVFYRMTFLWHNSGLNHHGNVLIYLRCFSLFDLCLNLVWPYWLHTGSHSELRSQTSAEHIEWLPLSETRHSASVTDGNSLVLLGGFGDTEDGTFVRHALLMPAGWTLCCLSVAPPVGNIFAWHGPLSWRVQPRHSTPGPVMNHSSSTIWSHWNGWYSGLVGSICRSG